MSRAFLETAGLKSRQIDPFFIILYKRS